MTARSYTADRDAIRAARTWRELFAAAHAVWEWPLHGIDRERLCNLVAERKEQWSKRCRIATAHRLAVQQAAAKGHAKAETPPTLRRRPATAPTPNAVATRLVATPPPAAPVPKPEADVPLVTCPPTATERVLVGQRVEASRILVTAAQLATALGDTAVQLATGDEAAVILAIKRAVAHYYGVPAGSLGDEARAARLVRARHVAMFLVREWTGASLPVIGRAFGGKHHTSVLHGLRKVEAQIGARGAVAADVRTLRAWLREEGSRVAQAV
jgi:Bacterial dnaA protein helix-turn-helix